MDIAELHHFFRCCVGNWTTERTYHYLSQSLVERSRTTFQVDPIAPELKQRVLDDNHYPTPVSSLEALPGFRLGFHTVSEAGEEVSQELRMLFVPKQQQGATLKGDYLRDRAYEEDRPIMAEFRYDISCRELLMTTPYTRVVSVDSITLINPDLRIRQILNYQRPQAGPLNTLLLAGFGVEQKTN